MTTPLPTKWSAKDPDDVADYWFDWSQFLPDAETITAATVEVPDGLTAVTNDFTTKTVRVRLSGGVDGTSYDIGCLITTSASQVFEITKTLQVKGRTT